MITGSKPNDYLIARYLSSEESGLPESIRNIFLILSSNEFQAFFREPTFPSELRRNIVESQRADRRLNDADIEAFKRFFIATYRLVGDQLKYIGPAAKSNPVPVPRVAEPPPERAAIRAREEEIAVGADDAGPASALASATEKSFSILRYLSSEESGLPESVRNLLPMLSTSSFQTFFSEWTFSSVLRRNIIESQEAGRRLSAADIEAFESFFFASYKLVDCRLQYIGVLTRSEPVLVPRVAEPPLPAVQKFPASEALKPNYADLQGELRQFISENPEYKALRDAVEFTEEQWWENLDNGQKQEVVAKANGQDSDSPPRQRRRL